jgi:hypothetical protein
MPPLVQIRSAPPLRLPLLLQLMLSLALPMLPPLLLVRSAKGALNLELINPIAVQVCLERPCIGLTYPLELKRKAGVFCVVGFTTRLCVRGL